MQRNKLNREDYKTAIPILEKRIEELEQIVKELKKKIEEMENA